MKTVILSLMIAVFFALTILPCHSAEEAGMPGVYAFRGEITENNVNVRSDSTVNSNIICTVNREDTVEVIQERYGEWYKIRLPKEARVYINKAMVAPLDDDTIKVIKDKVNIRLSASEASPILGKVNADEVLNVISSSRDWYKIEPPSNSFGWINKRFVNKAAQEKIEVKKVVKAKAVQSTKKTAQPAEAESQEEVTVEEITVEGVIKPQGKIFRQKTTHKLITEGGQTFMLKGNKEILDALNHHKVRVTGKIVASEGQKYPLIEVDKALEKGKTEKRI